MTVERSLTPYDEILIVSSETEQSLIFARYVVNGVRYLNIFGSESHHAIVAIPEELFINMYDNELDSYSRSDDECGEIFQIIKYECHWLFIMQWIDIAPNQIADPDAVPEEIYVACDITHKDFIALVDIFKTSANVDAACSSVNKPSPVVSMCKYIFTLPTRILKI
jgi:hypothetical protein